MTATRVVALMAVGALLLCGCEEEDTPTEAQAWGGHATYTETAADPGLSFTHGPTWTSPLALMWDKTGETVIGFDGEGTLSEDAFYYVETRDTPSGSSRSVYTFSGTREGNVITGTVYLAVSHATGAFAAAEGTFLLTLR